MITGIGHVAFRITDLDRALAFYCGTLGFREAFRLEREGEPSPWIVYLHVAPGQFLELFPGAEGRWRPGAARPATTTTAWSWTTCAPPSASWRRGAWPSPASRPWAWTTTGSTG